MGNTGERRVVVVGAGIIGSIIAWRIARDGAHVTVVEAREPGGVATPCSFGWINSTYGFPKHYFDLRVEAMRAWHRLCDDRAGLPYRQTGTIYIHLDDHDGRAVDLPAFVQSHSGWGYDIGLIEGDTLRQCAPHFRHLPDSGAWAPQEAVAEGDQTARLLLADAEASGATIITGTAVTRLLTQGECVTGVETALGPIMADEVVVAAGAATQVLIGDVAPAIPLKTPPGILLHTRPHAPLVPHLTLAKDLHIRQRTDGSILAGWDFGGRPESDDFEEAADQILGRIRQMFRGADDVEAANVSVGYRPTPGDGFPVVGRPGNIPGLTVAVMHSGITLAPFVGECVASFLKNGETHPLLEPFGPARFHDTPSSVA